VGGLACKGGAKSDRIRRSNDAAPVVVVAPTAGSARPKTSTVEREPNDLAAQATALALDTFGRGTMLTAADVDRYRLTVAKAGALTVTVSALAGVDLIVELRGAEDAVLAKSDRGGVKVDEGIGGYPVSPGAYDVVVRAFVKPVKAPPKKRGRGAAEAAGAVSAGSAAGAASGAVVVMTPASEEYEIVATVATPGSGHEVEPNADSGTAGELAIGETASGLLGWSGDVDVWKVGTEVLSASDALDLEVSAVDGAALTVELRDGLGRSTAIRKAARGQPIAIHGWSAAGPEGAPPFLYVVISGDRSHPRLPYQLHLVARAAAVGEEREPNDRVEAAQILGADEPLVHARWDVGDVDCFELPAADHPRHLEVTVDAGATTNLAAELVVGGHVLASSDEPLGKVERVIADVPAGARAVVKVRGAAKPGAEGSYDLLWGERSGDAMPPEEGAPARP
jgi:hypothetical protein